MVMVADVISAVFVPMLMRIEGDEEDEDKSNEDDGLLGWWEDGADEESTAERQ